MGRIATDYLDVSAERLPDKAAIMDERRTLTFSQLKAEAYHVAGALLRQGLFRAPVGIFLDKSTECVSAMMGAAYSGNFYTVLDTKMPSARIRRILDTLAPEVILTSGALGKAAAEWAGGIPVLAFEELQETAADEGAIEARKQQVLGTDVLYVLFTSGSTGTPKGVVTPHRSIVNYIEAAAPLFGIRESSVLGSQVPFYFVMSVLDIYGTLFAGATLSLIPQVAFSFPALLMKHIEEHRISVLYWVPSVLSMVANLDAFGLADISCVREVIFGGEVMPIKQLNAWRRHLPGARFINAYGPTEITDCCSYYVVDRDFPENARLPIGKALPNSELLVLDESGLPVAAEGTGELCVRSTSMNYGYYRDPERTAEVFVRNPLQEAYAETIYRTGDLVAFNEYGELEYVGRRDHQIKHMGQRIELGEIEANASAVDGVLENCCLYEAKRQRIVMFYSGSIGEKELGEALKTLLPAYMLPGKRIRMETLPHNLNGKIDRACLKGELS